MSISIKEVINAIHCLSSIDEKMEEIRKGQEEFREWMRKAIDEIDDRITRLEIIEENKRTFNALPNP